MRFGPLFVMPLGIGMPEVVGIPDTRLADLTIVATAFLHEGLVRRDQ